MLNSDPEFLSLFGWEGFAESPNPDPVSHSLFPARVICEERNLYLLQIGLEKVLWAAISGRTQNQAQGRVDYPAVGDWVLAERPPQSERAVIQQIVPRKSIIYRKQVASTDLQILSTNVDYVFITTSVNEDLSLRRLERYLAIAWEAGANPVILLTKADLCGEKIKDIVTAVQQDFPHVPVHALTKEDFAKADFFATYLAKGKTSVFIGSSGVGKSTLVNFLIGQEEIKTQEVRASDGKGRHTTTSRHLYVSRYQGLVIDTPGMRELQLSDHLEGVTTQFADIEDLMQRCRFTDCGHESEPGCAIKAGIASQNLSEARWLSYVKLAAEVRHERRKRDKGFAAEERKTWKKLSVLAREKGRSKKGELP